MLLHERIDLGFASLQYVLIKLLGDPKKTRRVEFRDCLPEWLVPPRPKGQDAMVLEATLETWARRDAVSQR